MSNTSTNDWLVSDSSQDSLKKKIEGYCGDFEVVSLALDKLCELSLIWLVSNANEATIPAAVAVGCIPYPDIDTNNGQNNTGEDIILLGVENLPLFKDVEYKPSLLNKGAFEDLKNLLSDWRDDLSEEEGIRIARHLICLLVDSLDEDQFLNVLQDNVNVASEGSEVTFGIAKENAMALESLLKEWEIPYSVM